MQFTKLISLLAAAVVATAENTVTFVSQDSFDRTVIFTSNPNYAKIPDTVVPASKNVTVPFPQGWQGNWYAVKKGEPNIPGMLGEVSFNGWNGITYFDVSAIVNPNDKDNVKQMWPADEEEPVSGCVVFPCNFAYYLPDDVQTRATLDTNLFCSLGSRDGSTIDRRSFDFDSSPTFPRDFVMGKWSKKN
ncbi:DNase1 protein [Rhypophila sp. PSN 637]